MSSSSTANRDRSGGGGSRRHHHQNGAAAGKNKNRGETTTMMMTCQDDVDAIFSRCTLELFEKQERESRARNILLEDCFQSRFNVNMISGIGAPDLRATWSLLARIDLQKFLRSFNIMLDRQVRAATNIVSYIHRILVLLNQLAKNHNLDLHVYEQTLDDLESRLDRESSVAILDDLGENPQSEAASAIVTARLLKLMTHLDNCVRSFLMTAAIRGGCSFADGVMKDTVRCLHLVHNEKHELYMLEGIQFRGFAEKQQHHRIDGFFLISLEYRAARGNVKYPSFVDRSGHLSALVRKFVRDVMLKNERLPTNIGVFLNLAMRRNCADFNVLRPLERNDIDLITRNEYNGGGSSANDRPLKDCHHDPSGVLALVDLAFVKYDNVKKSVIVKGYVVATFSSL